MPMPRKAASRMKFEKYESRRIWAGSHRMRATSRNSTRNEARKIRSGAVNIRLFYQPPGRRTALQTLI